MQTLKISLVGFGIMALVLTSAGQGVRAQTFTTGQLDKHCRSYLKLTKKTSKRKLTTSESVDVVKCTSFIAAFHYGKTAANILNDTFGPYCLPKNKQTTNWLVRNFVRWVARNPRQKNKVAGLGIMSSLRERYGCDERDRKK